MSVIDEGSGPTVVLLHAFPVNRHLWDGVVPGLVAAGFRVIAPDYAGLGDSPLPAEPPSVAAMAAQIRQVLTERGVDRFRLAGLSMGGYAAMQLVREIGPRIEGLALIDTKMAADTPPARDNRLAVATRAEVEGSAEFLVAAMLDNLLGPITRAERLDVVVQVERWIADAPPAAVAWAQRAMASRPDSTVDLAGFEGPALVLAGADDTISPPDEQRQIAATVPQAQLTLIPGVGHLSAVEDSAAVTDALLSWLR